LADWGGDLLRLHLVVLRCQAGDERAFAQLFEWFGDRTLRYLQNLVGEAAEDVQQEVWVGVYQRIASMTNPRAFRTWLFQNTRHRAIDFLRKQKRQRDLASLALSELSETADVTEDSDLFDAADFDEFLALLPAAHREVLLLRYRDDLSYAEIALVTGCAVGTIRSRLHHARQNLKKLMEQNARKL